MNKLVPGLRNYNRLAKREFAFNRFQWVLDGAVARGSQPYYVEDEHGNGEDEAHTVKDMDVTFLRLKKIVCIVSANRVALHPQGRNRLRAASIGYYHYKVRDFGAPTTTQLEEVADIIEHHRNRPKNPGATLVFCGYGQGRTGTYIAGWAMLKHMNGRPVQGMATHLALSAQFGVESTAQVQAIRALRTGLGAPPQAPAPAFPPGLGFSGQGLTVNAPAGNIPNFPSVNTDDIEW